ncbi:hypothetical protein DFH06DRAFT_1231875 [Mycena polygramma]|nr:hypothetical protein DFH06DRAFT_1231875 [Mycena polygramma]
MASLPAASLLRMRERIPLLREIHICADSETGYASATRHAFEVAPSLKLIRITEPRLHAHNRNMRPLSPFYDPTYNDNFCKSPYHFDALCLAQNLTVCQATVEHHRYPAWRPPSQPVRFEHLQKLTLFAPGALLDRLVLPALQHLFIEVYTPEFPHVVDLLLRSRCPLRTFWIKAHPPAAQYAQILAAHPDLCALRITECEARVFPAKYRARLRTLEKQGLEVQFRKEHERWVARDLLEYV